MSSAKYPIPRRELRRLNEANEEQREEASKKVRDAFIRTHSRETTVPVADSFTELRGVLEGTTDEEGRKGTEMLHAAREYDKQKDNQVVRRHDPDSNDE